MIPQDDNNTNRSLELCRRVVTTESFIEEAKAIYGDMYDYSKVDYKNREHQITVICPTHGDFKVYAREHLDGKRCPQCVKGEKFIQKLQDKFGEKFGLEQFYYVNSTTPITLVCPQHGAFTRTPNAILNTAFGCPECAKVVNQKSHIEAVARAEAKKQEKELAKQQEIANRISEWETRIQKIKSDIQTWASNPTKRTLVKLGLHTSPSFLYQNLVDERIDLIRHNTKWEENYRKTFLVAEDIALGMNIADYEIGDKLYKFDEEAAPIPFIEYYNSNEQWGGYTFEQRLSHRECIVFFRENDLYILFKYTNWKRQNDEFHARINEEQCHSKIDFPQSFVSIDFETLYSQRVSACSVGMVKFVDGKKTDSYYSLIKPPFDYPGKCGMVLTHIHGFTEDSLKNERTFDEVLPEMESFIGDLPLVAHNSSVEKGCIRDASAYYNVTPAFQFESMYDTLPLSRKVESQLGLDIQGEGTHTLDAVCNRFNVPVKNHHNALDDAEMCGNLIIAFKSAIDNNGIVKSNDSGETKDGDTIKEDKNQNNHDKGIMSFLKKIFG